jgi:hypothetical protein
MLVRKIEFSNVELAGWRCTPRTMKRCVLEANGFAASSLHLYVVGWARPGPAGRKTHFDVIDDLVTGAMRDRLRSPKA